jgi:hypothetical protein
MIKTTVGRADISQRAEEILSHAAKQGRGR